MRDNGFATDNKYKTNSRDFVGLFAFPRGFFSLSSHWVRLSRYKRVDRKQLSASVLRRRAQRRGEKRRKTTCEIRNWSEFITKICVECRHHHKKRVGINKIKYFSMIFQIFFGLSVRARLLTSTSQESKTKTSDLFHQFLSSVLDCIRKWHIK